MITTANSKKSPYLPSNDIVHRLAFDKSFQANIISIVSTGQIVLANLAARKLLGYSKKELLTRDRASIFKINDASFKKMLKERTDEGHSTAEVTLIRKSGTLIPCEITSTVFMDDGIEKSITTIKNLSKSILKQKNLDIKKEKLTSDDIVIAQALFNARLQANKDWIKYVTEVSYDVLWDWDIATDSLYVGNSIEEVFGYNVRNNMMSFKDFISCIVPFEKERVEKKLLKTIASASKVWDDAFLFKRHDGSISSTISRASIVRDKDGKAVRIIGAMQDVSKLKELETRLKEGNIIWKEHRDIFQLAAKLSYEGIWNWNLAANEFLLGEGFGDLFGDTVKDRTGNMTDWSKHLHPDDKVAIETGLQQAIANGTTRWDHTYRFIRADGSIAEVFGRANIIRDRKGRATRIIGSVHDISKQGMLEERLKDEIDLREMQIAEAIKDAKDTERSDIGRELHDNVNQLLGASKMYLDMAKGGAGNSAMFIARSTEYTLAAIEEIRKLTKGLTTDIIQDLGLCVAIENIIHDMTEVNPVKISFSRIDFSENGIDSKFKINLYRIIQEHLNNVLKHAKAKKISISLAQDKTSVHLTISDNGVGFDTSKKQKGIGLENIKSRATSYKGKASFVSSPGHGCVLDVSLPVTPLVFSTEYKGQ